MVPLADTEGGSPLRCCLRHSTPGERIALISYAPLRRWAAETGAEPGPYDEQGPVFIHAEACEGPVVAGEGFPFARERRVLRRYSWEGRIVGGGWWRVTSRRRSRRRSPIRRSRWCTCGRWSTGAFCMR